MNATKTLTSLAAAAALVGTIGFASAQSNVDTMNSPATTPDSSTQVEASPAQVAPADSSTSTQAPAATSTTSTDTTIDNSSNTMDTERAPQADRN